MTYFYFSLLNNKKPDKLMKNVFDKNGKHIFSNYLTKPQANIKIDFLNKIVNIFILIPLKNSNQINNIYDKKLILTKQFKIFDNYSKIKIDENIYNIPKFFNKKMLIQKDFNTYEILFFNIFRDIIHSKLKLCS